mmetsp:Transcript_6333/g.11717  ORF Transcript_6333/g.11717 Transcript_6333/m.11717 type:complete len:85 (-) Transcript_6333:905-1159(-)
MGERKAVIGGEEMAGGEVGNAAAGATAFVADLGADVAASRKGAPHTAAKARHIDLGDPIVRAPVDHPRELPRATGPLANEKIPE